MFLTILWPIFWAHAIGEFRYITDEAEVFVLNRTQLHEFKIQIIDETNASNVINSDWRSENSVNLESSDWIDQFMGNQRIFMYLVQ